MSWFTKFVAHPFVAALSTLSSHPAITSNPAAAAAVSDAKAQAETVAATVNTGAAALVSDADVLADPALAALGSGIITGVDAFAMASLGPVGGQVAVALANPLLTLGEAKAHDLITAAFAHLRAQLAAQKAAPAPAAAG